MPLEWGRIIRYNVDRMTFEFTMIDKAKAKIVDCRNQQYCDGSTRRHQRHDGV
jgi:hypothetical protein